MASKALDHRLKEITTTYHSFVEDQVLTDTQLNEFLNYFDDQDGLTRIALSGVGIVCGFEPTLKDVTDVTTQLIQKQLEITKGFGVTTDGDLLYLRKPGSKELIKDINFQSVVFTNYRKFEDNSAEYAPFKDNGPGFEMWEVLQSHEVTNSVTEPLLTNLPGVDNMVALLYLEWYQDDSNLCDELSCDSQGKLVGARLRVLLVSQANAAIILSKDSLFTKHDLMAVYQQMKDVSVPRVVLNSVLTGNNSQTATQLNNAYKLSNFGTAISEVKGGLQLMAAKLNPHYPTNGIAGILTEMDAKLPAASATPSLFYQYRYDLLKDVVDTYNELKEAFIQISTECFPSITSFPKHLMLGKIKANEQDKLISRYRHKFYRSPILAETPAFEIFTSLLDRLAEMLKSYPVLPETNAGTGLLRPEIKITPSNYRTTLGKKAIPFYYNLTTSLLKKWNFEKTAVGKYRKNLSYNTGLLEQIPQILTPLKYNLEPYPFFRIEGHQGRDYREVLTKIDLLKKQNALSFDVKALCVDIDSNFVIDPTEYACEFEDLSVLLKAWVNEQQCGIAKATSLLSAYSIKVPGYNILEEQYTGPIGVVYKPPKFSADKAINAGEEVAAKAMAEEAEVVPNKRMAKARAASGIEATKEQVIANNKMYYGGNATVIDNLTAQEDTIGGAFLYALENQPNGMPNDLVLAANYYVDRYIEEQAIDWDPPIKVILVNNTLHLLAYLQALSNSIPISVEQIDDAVISKYTTNIDNLCSTLQKVQVTYTDSTTLTTKNRAILGLLVNQLTTICCAAKQLQALLKEIDDRKDAILERLTLKKFIEEHPGLEHLGGVENGGTFVVVYLRKGTNVVGGVQNTPNGTVLADFSLPYMCCSDCAPINFIVPKAPVSLTLPKDVVCLGANPEVLTFNVEPADGVIKADPEITGVSIVGDELTINPLTFDKTKLNQVIKFTVNDQVTNCQLVVKEPYEADFDVPATPATNTLVAFSPNDTYPAGTKFEWNFGDGNVSTEESVEHNYSLPLSSGSNNVQVTLKVIPADGACPTTVTKSFSFAPVSIDITPKNFCNNDAANYNFVIVPTGANPTITGLGVNTANRTFSPLNLIPGSVPIMLNGAPVLSLQVAAKPTVIVDGNIQNNSLTLTSNLTAGMTYKWTFVDVTGTKEVHAPITNNVNPIIPLAEFTGIGEGEVFTAILTVESTCGQVIKQKSFQLPVTRVTISLPQAQFCNNDARVYNFTIMPAGATANLSGPGVDNLNKTFKAYQLPVGNANITVNGQPGITVSIIAPPTNVNFSMEIRAEELLLSEVVPAGHTFTWKFTKPDGTKIAAELYDISNPKVRLAEMNDIKPGELIVVTLIVESPCGDVIVQHEIPFPDAQQLNTCQLDASEDIGKLSDQLRVMMSTSTFTNLTASQKTFFSDYDQLLKMVEENLQDVLSGGMNDLIVGRELNRLKNLKNAIFVAKEPARTLLFDLYKLGVASFYSIIQCQDEENLVRNEQLMALVNEIKFSFNPENQENFRVVIQESDPTGMFKAHLEDVLSYRVPQSETHSDLSQLMSFIF